MNHLYRAGKSLRQMHKISFFPIENADCCRITLNSGERLLFDYCHRKKPGDTVDKKIDLAGALKADLMPTGKLRYEVACFTHLDSDHVDGASDFFWFDHATKYQADNRVKIGELWVPAAALLEANVDDCARVIRQEARYRLRNKSGIRVFSAPGVLEDWLKAEGIPIEDVRHLIVNAGTLVPGWDKTTKGVEFFVHSPFGKRLESGVLVDRNNNAIFLQATFLDGGRDTRLILSADIDNNVIEDIVKVTKWHHNDARLGWDINNVPHHSSYRSVNQNQDRFSELIPSDDIHWLYQQGGTGGYLVSTSKPIPLDATEKQPPHKNAAAYYKARAAAIAGEYVVSMEYPAAATPSEMIFEITGAGAKLKKQSSTTGSGGAIGGSAPRAGRA